MALAAIAWAAMLPAAAQAAAAQRPSLRVFAIAVYGFGSAICHQRAERSLHLSGVALPVCARCTGIYVGSALAAAAIVLARRTRFARGSIITGWRAGSVLMLAALPGALSLAYEWATGDVPSNSIRAATGIVFGGAAGWLILHGIANEPHS